MSLERLLTDGKPQDQLPVELQEVLSAVKDQNIYIRNEQLVMEFTLDKQKMRELGKQNNMSADGMLLMMQAYMDEYMLDKIMQRHSSELENIDLKVTADANIGDPEGDMHLGVQAPAKWFISRDVGSKNTSELPDHR